MSKIRNYRVIGGLRMKSEKQRLYGILSVVVILCLLGEISYKVYRHEKK